MFSNVYSASFFYSETLYHLPDSNSVELPASNDAKVLVVCKNPAIPTSNEITFLNNILKAVGLTPDMAQVIHFNPSTVLNFGKIIRFYHPEKMLCFGFNASDLQLNVKIGIYSPRVLLNTTIILADALHLLESEQQKKAILWQKLKHIFNI